MITTESIHQKVLAALDTEGPKPDESFEKSKQRAAMDDAVGYALGHPDLEGTQTASQLASLPTQKAFWFLWVNILPGLRDPRYGLNSRTSATRDDMDEEESKEVVVSNENSTSQSSYSPGSGPKADPAGDFYRKLGVERKASKEEIDTAYRKWAKENHPDVLRAKGLTPEEVNRAEENAYQMGEAYNTLNNPKHKAEYDKFWDENFAGASQSREELPTGTPLLKDSNESEDEVDQSSFSYIDINYRPSKTNLSSVKEAQTLTHEFRETVGNVGNFSLDKMASGEMKFYSLYPESFTDSQVASALKMHADGVDSAQFAQEVMNNKILTKAEREEFLNIAYFQEALASSGVEGLPSAEVLALAGSRPAAGIMGAAEWKTFVPGKFTFERRVAGKLAPVFRAGEKGLGSAITNETKSLAVKGIKLGTRKLAKVGSKVALEAGSKVAAKAAFGAVLGGILEAVGIPVAGPLGAFIAGAITWIVTELLFGLISLVKKLLDPKTLIKVLMLLSAGLAVLGMTGLSLGALGFGVYRHLKMKGGGNFSRGLQGSLGSIRSMVSGAIAVMFAAMGVPILIAFVAIPFAIALIIFIITTGAYVVPPFLTDSAVVFSNPYMEVKKTLKAVDATKCLSPDNGPSYIKCQNTDLAVEIEYTITVTAKRGPLIDVSINDNCQVERESASVNPGCPPPSLNTGPLGGSSFPLSPPENQVSPTEPYTFTYTRNFASPLSFADSLVFDTITVSATSSDGTSESISSSASMCVGDCPAGCYEISDANRPWSQQGQYRNDLQQSINTLTTQYPNFTRKACSDGNKIPICYGGASPDGRWGDHFGHGSSCDITLYKNSDGTPNNYVDVLYVLTHEIGHHITHVAPQYFAQYRSYQGIGSELPLCNNSVSTDPADIFGFCDSSALYISGLSMTRFRNCSSPQGLQGAYPNHASFVENVMLSP